MIRHLKVENLGIIKRAQVEFKEGFNVITGESGSGKSLLVKALSLALGAKADKELVHPKADQLKIEIVFETNDWLKSKLEEIGIETYEETILRRTVSKDGKSRVFINDSQVTLKKLREIAEGLLEIQGQRETIKLLQPDYQRSILDRFAQLDEKLKSYKRLYQEYINKTKELQELDQNEQENKRRIDYLRYVLDEIEAANLNIGEEEKLKQERKMLSNLQQLKEVGERVNYLLAEGEVNASQLISQVIVEVSKIADISDELKEAQQELEEILDRLEGARLSLLSVSDSLEYSEERLSEIEERLDLIYKLKNKYGNSIEEILEFQERVQEELATLESKIFYKEDLEKELQNIQKELQELAKEISNKRQKAAKILAEKISNHLVALGFEYPRFSVNLKSKDNFGPFGIDEVEFLFSANPDTPLKPLKDIASGGELSRVILATKAVISDKEDVGTIVFDEVDTGIGGLTAKSVGKMLRNLGKAKQVIAITHFPQVAAYAHHHIKVEKTLKGKKTFVKVQAINEKEKEIELEKMAGFLVKSFERGIDGKD
ncbi:DNA repair protein RecN [Thermosulfidibacter takaii ABI70S6]|uniref:DNA repair protein RecN n=1 Tax=Thermosulfidibacter takaii (strain DSM 17441 / JCM 13301 / NBRC 103674 / ABI70S6) TaxID=1298851 RepID=A0A0S3QU12_THET7|nr:DNA repair protein RecN [Thermosulfidibacter takaii]BAT71808.1 DNA repair protein RecN [Thermosulfidibacter takaii ABI70S6]